MATLRRLRIPVYTPWIYSYVRYNYAVMSVEKCYEETKLPLGIYHVLISHLTEINRSVLLLLTMARLRATKYLIHTIHT